MADKDLQVQEKQELQTRSESTRNVPIFVPTVDIYENEAGLTLLADMPGVAIENVDIDLEKDQLTIKGSVPADTMEGTALLREYVVGDYYRQFILSKEIDQGKIEAAMKDGVLKVFLPKVEAAKPRKIKVSAV
jgi:HSP20 family protein